MNRIYVDNAATTPISDTARRVLLETMDRAWGNPSSLHTVGGHWGCLESSDFGRL